MQPQSSFLDSTDTVRMKSGRRIIDQTIEKYEWKDLQMEGKTHNNTQWDINTSIIKQSFQNYNSSANITTQYSD